MHVRDFLIGRCDVASDGLTAVGDYAYRCPDKDCDKLKTIHVPVNTKSWAEMKDWFGIPLVFDAK